MHLTLLACLHRCQCRTNNRLPPLSATGQPGNDVELAFKIAVYPHLVASSQNAAPRPCRGNCREETVWRQPRPQSNHFAHNRDFLCVTCCGFSGHGACARSANTRLLWCVIFATNESFQAQNILQYLPNMSTRASERTSPRQRVAAYHRQSHVQC
jgi:hypothetical protein